MTPQSQSGFYIPDFMDNEIFRKACGLQSQLYDIERQINNVEHGDVIQINRFYAEYVPDVIKEAVANVNAKYLEYLLARKAELEREFDEL